MKKFGKIKSLAVVLVLSAVFTIMVMPGLRAAANTPLDGVLITLLYPAELLVVWASRLSSRRWINRCGIVVICAALVMGLDLISLYSVQDFVRGISGTQAAERLGVTYVPGTAPRLLIGAVLALATWVSALALLVYADRRRKKQEKQFDP